MITLEQLLISVLWGLTVMVVVWYIGTVTQRITYVTLADGRRQQRQLPVLFRLLLPLAPNLNPLWRKQGLERIRERLDQRIVSAGFEGLISPEELLSLRLLEPLVMGPLWILFVRGAAVAGQVALLINLQPLLMVLGLLWLSVHPAMWLRQAIASRHGAIQRALPFVLDLLTLSVEAGMDFMSALQRNIDRRALDPLGEELIRVIREIQLGKTRRTALRDMSRRVNLADLRAVINALVQADELGVSIGAILRIQSDQMRQRRFERAERLANEAPVKMLFPLMAFIFPAVFLVLLGPIIHRLMQQGF